MDNRTDKTKLCDMIAEIIIADKEVIMEAIKTNDKALISLEIENMMD